MIIYLYIEILCSYKKWGGLFLRREKVRLIYCVLFVIFYVEKRRNIYVYVYILFLEGCFKNWYYVLFLGREIGLRGNILYIFL